MAFVYIDESGDVGGNSKYITFAAVVVESERPLEKMIRKIWRAKPQYHKKGRLHAVGVDDATRTRMLAQLADLEVGLRVAYFRKPRSIGSQELRYYKELADFIGLFEALDKIIIEKKDTVKKRNEVIRRLGLETSFSSVVFLSPQDCRQLQAADFVAWAHGRVLERQDSSFYRHVQDKIL